jgi:hypothetical protein
VTRRVLILDTTVLCCLLKIPGKDIAGPDDDHWDHDRISELLELNEGEGSTFVLPLATLIETGNHIAQASQRRYELAQSFASIIRKAADATSPWAAFADQENLWGTRKLNELADTWPDLAAQRMTIGDATIKDVANWYAEAGFAVEIVTGDAGLKAYEPLQPPPQPRRRS